MADEGAKNRPAEPSDRSSSPESEDDDGGLQMPVESLVSGREKRSNAGNLMSTLLDQAEEEDELTLLFEEPGIDEEFDGDNSNDQSDARFDSSDNDDDDGGPAAGNEDEELEGEKELQRQAREARKKQKRKLEAGIWKAPGMRKKVKIDPMASVQTPKAPIARPKKKADRVSWIQGEDDTPVRSSSRKATIQNKQVVHERMKESEARRVKQLASMEATAAKKEQAKAKVLTQEDRLAEAARVEKINSKSLSRWEQDEKSREAERKAKLVALHHRQMDGPVIRFWSGRSKWMDGRLVEVGKSSGVPIAPGEAVTSMDKSKATQGFQPLEQPDTRPVSASQRRDSQDIEKGVHDLSVKEEPRESDVPPPVDATDIIMIDPGPSSTTSIQNGTAESTTSTLVQTAARAHEYATRNLIILEDFDTSTLRDPSLPRHPLVKRSRGSEKPVKSTPQYCAITSQPAKYRDPSTGIPYASRYAYQQIQRLKANEFKWSDLLGCFVGTATMAAKGVPDGFLDGTTGFEDQEALASRGSRRGRGRARGRVRGRGRGRGP
ncbi:MAG: hypothetical protein M1814_006535 [Vezdaea aestivalis]|nr:MAG: hypothetical protein M1814_006535 [Vezdaea aestivalis]